MNSLIKRAPFLGNLKVLGFALAVLIVGASVHRYLLGNYNNLQIFRFSFLNLLQGLDLYAYHPGQHEDLYKYSPTFALLMAPFYALPAWLSLIAWNLLNALLVFYAIRRLKLSDEQKALALLFLVIELLGSIQNTQSNGMMAGLMMLGFTFLEEGKPWRAALLICLGFYVKLFAIVAALLFVFYNGKIRFLLAMAFWGMLLAVLPALVAGWDGLIMHYKSWLHLLVNDPAHELNYSLMTFMQRSLGIELADLYYLVPGALILLAPLLRVKEHSDYTFRLLFLASILIWVVIFNHKAESPTYAIAMCGAALWWVTQRSTPFNVAMAIFVFVFTGLIATDLFPREWRDEFFKPYAIKALPCIVLWVYVELLLLTGKYRTLRAAEA